MTVAWPAVRPPGPILSQQKQFHNPPAREANVEAPELYGMNVLVVDDLGDVGAVLADMLEAAGATAISETDPREAQRILTVAPYVWSALVCDLHMPHIDGRDLARSASKMSPPLPVVLVTARSETLSETERTLFSILLQKPVSAARLALAVQTSVLEAM